MGLVTSVFSAARGLGGFARSAFSAVQKYAGAGSMDSLRSIAMDKNLMRATGELFAKV